MPRRYAARLYAARRCSRYCFLRAITLLRRYFRFRRLIFSYDTRACYRIGSRQEGAMSMRDWIEIDIYC